MNLQFIQITGILAMVGALIYAIGDVLLLAGKVSLDDYPKLKMYIKLLSGTERMVFITTLLFGIASVIGAFVHGTFYYMGEYVQALNKVDEFSQVIIAEMIQRHRKVLMISYAPVLILIIIASILFSWLVFNGNTAFPVWMAAVNPVTLTIAWLILKRLLPQSVRDRTEGAGFNIAFLAFFACTTLT